MAVKLATAKAKTGTAYTIAAKDLESLETEQIRFGVTDQSVRDLARNIADRGQLQPALIVRMANGNPKVIAGNTRLQAIRLINENPKLWGLTHPLELKCVLVEPGDENDVLLAAYQTNVQQPIGVMDLAKMVQTLSNRGFTGERIVELLRSDIVKLSEQRLGILKRIMTLPLDIHRMIFEGKVKESGARAIFKVAEAAELSNAECVAVATAMVEKHTFAELLKVVKPIASKEHFTRLFDMVAGANTGDETVTVKSILATVNQTKRKEGVSLKRTVDELSNLLATIDTPDTKIIAEWLNGEHDDMAVIRIFRSLAEETDDE